MTVPSSPVSSDVQYTGDGSDVDIIIADNGVWIGHPEFNSNAVNGLNPWNFKSGNPLSVSGTCQVLDLVLDAPYYIDKAWFDADAGNRLTTRWDGTVVPTEAAAKLWWASSTSRSSQYANIGTVSITDAYTRLNCHGSNTQYATNATHGTQCASQAYGRNFGWAYNANKWMIHAFLVGDYSSFVIQKLFHLYKPVNPTYGTQDPTISSNSWGYRYSIVEPSYAFFRSEAPVRFTSPSDRPAWLKNFYQTSIRNELRPSPLTVAGDELIEAGVIFFCSAGNTNQKMVNPGHPDYNNFYGPNPDSTIQSYVLGEGGGQERYASINRPGFPQQIGKTSAGLATIVIGALDNDLGPNGIEQKVNYSNTGEAVDVFAIADETLAAYYTNSGGYPRYDSTIPGGITAQDCYFNGTSSATPIAAGLIACKLQSNRSWTWRDVKNYIKNNIVEQTTTAFKDPGEIITSDSALWIDQTNPNGAKRRILWNADTTPSANLELIIEAATKTLTQTQTSVNFRPVRAQGGSGNYTYSVSPALPSGLSLNVSTGYITGSANVTSLETTYTISVVDNG